MTKAPGSVLITPVAAETRRDLGPAAWVVAEALVARARPHAQGSLLAVTSIRRLANDLGLDKDTVARALTRLKEAGLVTWAESRQAGYVVRSIPGLVTLDVSERPGDLSSEAASHPTKGDSVSCPVSGDKPASKAELSIRATKATKSAPRNDVPNTPHSTHSTQTNATSPHQQSLFAPPDTDPNNATQIQSLTALSERATTNAFAASTHTATTTSSPTDSCHLAMAEAAGPAAPGRDVARKLGGSSHPTPSPKSEGKRC